MQSRFTRVSDDDLPHLQLGDIVTTIYNIMFDFKLVIYSGLGVNKWYIVCINHNLNTLYYTMNNNETCASICELLSN